MIRYFKLVILILLDLTFLITLPFFFSEPDNLMVLFGIINTVLVFPINFYVIKWIIK